MQDCVSALDISGILNSIDPSWLDLYDSWINSLPGKKLSLFGWIQCRDEPLVWWFVPVHWAAKQVFGASKPHLLRALSLSRRPPKEVRLWSAKCLFGHQTNQHKPLNWWFMPISNSVIWKSQIKGKEPDSGEGLCRQMTGREWWELSYALWQLWHTVKGQVFISVPVLAKFNEDTQEHKPLKPVVWNLALLFPFLLFLSCCQNPSRSVQKGGGDHSGFWV